MADNFGEIVRKYLISACVFSLISSYFSASYASICLRDIEEDALRIRQFHIELMVAALKCGNDAYGIRDRYGRYVKAHGGTLSGNARDLRSYFNRSYGRDSSRQFDQFITRLANDASIRSQGVATYCQDAGKWLDAVNAVETLEGLRSLAVAATPFRNEFSRCDAALSGIPGRDETRRQ